MNVQKGLLLMCISALWLSHITCNFHQIVIIYSVIKVANDLQEQK